MVQVGQKNRLAAILEPCSFNNSRQMDISKWKFTNFYIIGRWAENRYLANSLFEERPFSIETPLLPTCFVGLHDSGNVVLCRELQQVLNGLPRLRILSRESVSIRWVPMSWATLKKKNIFWECEVLFLANYWVPSFCQFLTSTSNFHHQASPKLHPSGIGVSIGTESCFRHPPSVSEGQGKGVGSPKLRGNCGCIPIPALGSEKLAD